MQLSILPNPRVRCREVYVDPHFLVIGKEPGVVTQPGVGHDRDTLLNYAFAHHGPALQALGKRRDFGLVHRLDRPTSGLVLVGLTPEGYDGLRDLFERRRVKKTYVALVHGVPRAPQGTVREPIREGRRGGRKYAFLGEHHHAQPAVTRYTVLARSRVAALLECEIETGRLHQIRAHLAHLGHPVVGDREYGRRDDLDRRFAQAVKGAVFLHAGALGFAHPVEGPRVEVEAPLPERTAAFLSEVGLTCPRRWR